MKILGNDALVFVEVPNLISTDLACDIRDRVKDVLARGEPVVLTRGVRVYVLQLVRGQMEVAVIGSGEAPVPPPPAPAPVAPVQCEAQSMWVHWVFLLLGAALGVFGTLFVVAATRGGVS